MDLHYNLVLSLELHCVDLGGRRIIKKKTSVESSLKYHPAYFGTLTSVRDPDQGQRQAGSLTGAVAS